MLVASEVGGYRHDQGWDPTSNELVEAIGMSREVQHSFRPCWKRDGPGWRPSERRVSGLPSEDHADAADADESMSVAERWQTIAIHGLQVGREAERIASRIGAPQARLLHLAGRWHDVGKSHPAFQSSIQADDRPGREDIAKAPDIAWPCSVKNMYRIDAVDRRRGFRHELASTLSVFGVLQRHKPEHQALLGSWREFLESVGEADGLEPCADSSAVPSAIEQEVLDLTDHEFDLLAYLVCAHHGKVRMAWHASPVEPKAGDLLPRIHGVRDGDVLPPLILAGYDGELHQLPATLMDLSPSEAGLSSRTGRSWTERVLNLVERFGPFTLAWLEALLRAADQLASRQTIRDILLQEQENGNDGCPVDGDSVPLAQAAGGGASPPPPRSDSPSRRQLHGNGERASRGSLDSGTTRPSRSATRYIETSFGILSYQKLAPLLAERVADTELAISDRRLADLPIHELLLQLHRRVCEDLVPEIAGPPPAASGIRLRIEGRLSMQNVSGTFLRRTAAISSHWKFIFRSRSAPKSASPVPI